MKKFEELLSIADVLYGPEGCPWDREQTFFSLQPYVLEEAHEVIEAVDQNDIPKIIEELGDLLYTIIFYAKIAESEKKFTIEDIIDTVKEKLIRRHPHVFGEAKIHKTEEVVKEWEKIKKAEKGHGERKSILDGIPPTLPTLAKAQKILKKILHHRVFLTHLSAKKSETSPSEEEIGEELLRGIIQAIQSGFDAESALRRRLAHYEQLFREWEKTKAP